MMRNIIIYLTFLLLLPNLANAQADPRLAEQYYHNGEYEKASSLYEKLAQQNNGDHYFERYLECLMQMEQYAEAEKVVQKQLKKEPKKTQLYVSLGLIYERQGKEAESNQQYQTAINKLDGDRFAIQTLANAFSNQTKYDLALQTYERGSSLIKDQRIFAMSMAELYRRKDNRPKMIEFYLNSLEDNPNNLSTVETYLQRYLQGDEDSNELQSQLYARIQADEKNITFVELLTWMFLQRKDYKNAFRQAKALDRQLEENGGRIFNLSQIAANDKDYDAAIQGYEYIISEKGTNSSFYIDAKRNLLNTKRNKLTEGYTYTTEELRLLEREYEQFLDELGRNKTTATIIAELANLEAFYINDLDKAIALLSDMIDYVGVDRLVQARAKLSLGDFYLMKDEIWEATLLYSQVDKAFKDDIMGHDARFRNARLSYYDGDFTWAQAQFDVLKASTSKLIANDALDLSVFILDNLGLDSITTPLELYAQSDLLVFQNRFQDAFAKMDTIVKSYPGHTLEDDIYYLEAHIFAKQRNYVKAAEKYQRIIDNFSDGIRCDNSIYELAALYEGPLNDTEKAKTLYEKLFIDFSNSTFAVEARKKYRRLRGDGVQ